MSRFVRQPTPKRAPCPLHPLLPSGLLTVAEADARALCATCTPLEWVQNANGGRGEWREIKNLRCQS